MGVPSIKEFALPLIIGIFSGMYSSVFITGSVWYIFKTKFVKKEIKSSEQNLLENKKRHKSPQP